MGTNRNRVDYRPVAGFPGYLVGDDGSVWTSLRGGWKRLSACRNTNGYLHVGLYPGRAFRLVHRLVLEAFVGPCPGGMEACHLDDDRANNRLANLRWDTPQANRDEAARRDRIPRGSRHHRACAKLTPRAVGRIRRSLAAGVARKVLAGRYGVTLSNIDLIANRKTWRHVA